MGLERTFVMYVHGLLTQNNNELLQLQNGTTTRPVDSRGRFELYSRVLMTSEHIGKVLNIFSHEEDTN